MEARALSPCVLCAVDFANLPKLVPEELLSCSVPSFCGEQTGPPFFPPLLVIFWGRSFFFSRRWPDRHRTGRVGKRPLLFFFASSVAHEDFVHFSLACSVSNLFFWTVVTTALFFFLSFYRADGPSGFPCFFLAVRRAALSARLFLHSSAVVPFLLSTQGSFLF